MKSFFVFSLSILISTLSFSDTKIVTVSKSDGFQGLGAHTRTETRYIKGIKSKVQEKTKFKGLMRLASGQSETITRIDLDKIWRVNSKKKTYTEHPVKFKMPTFKEKWKQQQKAAGAPPQKEQPPTHRVKKSTFDVKKTGNKKTANKFPLEEYNVTMMMEVEDLRTKFVTKYEMINNVWTTPWTKSLRQASNDQMAFTKAYLKKLGASVSPDQKKLFDAENITKMLGVPGSQTNKALKNVKKKMATIKGFPIITESTWMVHEDPKAVAQRKAAMKKANSKENEKESDYSMDDGAKGIASKFLGGFAKKKIKERQMKKMEAKKGQPMLKTRIEVKAVDTASLANKVFELKKGLKKIEQKNFN